MKVLIYSDLHSDLGNEMCFSQPGEHLQIRRVRLFYERLLELYKKYGCAGLIDLGDTFGDRSSLHYQAINVVIDGLRPFPESEMNLKLVGNHEQHYHDQSLDIGCIFEPKFSVIHKTDVFEALDTLIACAAYPASDSALADWLSKTAYQYRNYERRLLLGHFQVVGCHMPSGQAVMGVPQDVLNKYSLALLGHIHRPQQTGRTSFYVGSPFQQNFGEKNESKRVGILDLETMGLEWVPMPGFPEYRVVDFDKWIKTVQEKEEHRYQVIIRDPKQAERFYKHSLMGCAEPIYNYELDERTKAEVAQAQNFSRQDVMVRWLQQHPPGDAGIQASPEEVLEVGDLLAAG